MVRIRVALGVKNFHSVRRALLDGAARVKDIRLNLIRIVKSSKINNRSEGPTLFGRF